MKVTALVLAVLLALSLCACAPMNNRGTGTDNAVRGDSGNAAGTGADRDAQIAEEDADGAGTADAGLRSRLERQPCRSRRRRIGVHLPLVFAEMRCFGRQVSTFIAPVAVFVDTCLISPS